MSNFGLHKKIGFNSNNGLSLAHLPSINSLNSGGGGGSSLPNATQFGQYPYYSGTNWVIGGETSIVLGNNSGQNNQGNNTVAIGINSGKNSQGDFSIAIGNNAGDNSQLDHCIAIGNNAGSTGQLAHSIAIGSGCGRQNQGQYCIAIGDGAGNDNQGINSIAIGQNAGQISQPNNSIVINSTGNVINGIASGFCAAPLNSTASALNNLVYDTVTNEILYQSAKTFVIDHPVNTNKYLVHSCLEGPEVGVYYRGESEIVNGKYVDIELPNYTNRFYNYNIFITSKIEFESIDDFPDEYINMSNFTTTNVINRKFRVYNGSVPVYNGSGCIITPIKFNYLVIGKRLELNVEPDKISINVKGNGPYKYIE